MLFIIDQYTLAISQLGVINVFTVLPLLLLTVITVAFFFLFDAILHAIQNKQLLEISNKQLEQEQQYHIILLNKHQQFQKLRHDMKDDFNNIAGLIKNNHCEDALVFAQKQSGQLALTAAIQTGYPMLDTILTLKEEQARQQNIQLQSYVSGNLALKGLNMDDLASLCSNVLNNALEAVAKVTEPEQRNIWCQLVQNKGYLYFTVRNATAEPVCIEHDSIVSTKTDKKLHGFGLTIIKSIVKKYDGSYSFSYEEGLFTVKIVLPAVEGELE